MNGQRSIKLQDSSRTEAPNSKHQAPDKNQTPSTKTTEERDLGFGSWSFSGAWRLEFGASYFHPPFFITSFTLTSLPPSRLLSSAASINARISIVSSGFTGATPDLKNSIMARTSGT